MEAGLVKRTTDDGVGTITLSRPEALNAFNLELAREFLASLDAFEGDSAVRVVVLRGAGRVFSAGGDIREMLADVQSGEDPAAYFKTPLSAFGEMILALRTTPNQSSQRFMVQQPAWPVTWRWPAISGSRPTTAVSHRRS